MLAQLAAAGDLRVLQNLLDWLLVSAILGLCGVGDRDGGWFQRDS